MAKDIYADEKVNQRIDALPNAQLREYYKIIYSTIVNHFIAYRMISTGHFK